MDGITIWEVVNVRRHNDAQGQTWEKSRWQCHQDKEKGREKTSEEAENVEFGVGCTDMCSFTEHAGSPHGG